MIEFVHDLVPKSYYCKNVCNYHKYDILVSVWFFRCMYIVYVEFLKNNSKLFSKIGGIINVKTHIEGRILVLFVL